jgi:hypothetical protein
MFLIMLTEVIIYFFQYARAIGFKGNVGSTSSTIRIR